LPWRRAPSASREGRKLGQVDDPRLLRSVLEIPRNQNFLPAQISIGQGRPADVVDCSVSAQNEEVEEWDREVLQLNSSTKTCPENWEEAED
jgi:hypothetical protein